MKILAVFALLAIRIFALDIVNGDVVVLKLDKSTSELSFGPKQIPLITAPNSSDKIAVLADSRSKRQPRADRRFEKGRI